MPTGSSNAIGTGAVVLTASTDQLASGLDKAQADVAKWAKQTEAKAGAAGGGTGGGGGLLGKMLTGGASAAGFAAGFATAAVTDSLKGAVNGLKELAAQGRAADSLGIPVEQLTALSGAAKVAGIEGVNMAGVLGDLQQKSLEAVKGNDAAAEAFGRLGLRVSEVARMSSPDQLNAVADAIAKLPPGARQADAAMSTLGGAGKALLPLLQQGSAGLGKFTDEAKKLGLSVNAAEMERVQKAAAALARTQAATEGLKTKFLTAVAPAVEAGAGLISGVLDTLAPLIEKAGEAANAFYHILAAAFDAAKEAIGGVITEIGKWVSETFNLSSVTVSTADVVFGAMRFAAKGAALVWDTLKAGAGVMSYVGSFIVDGFAHIVDAFRDTIRDLLQIAGKLPDDLGGEWFRKQAEQVEGWGGAIHKAADQMREWGKGTFANWGKSVADVDAFFDRTRAKFDRRNDAAGKAGAKDNGVPFTKPELSGAFERGTKEAYSIIARNDAGNMLSQSSRDVAKQQLDVAKQIQQGQKELIDWVKGAAVLKMI